MAIHDPTTPTPLPMIPRPLVIGHVLTPAEVSGLLRIGEALSDIKERLAALMGRPGGPLAGELADLATVALDLLDIVEGDLEAEPDNAPEDGGDAEPSLGWSGTGATTPLNASPFLLDLDEEHDGREPDADDADPWHAPPRLDVFAEPLPAERDAALNLCGSHRVGDDDEEAVIERFRSKPRKVPVTVPAPAAPPWNPGDVIVAQEPSAEAQARADAIVAAWDAYNAQRDRLRAETGLEGVEEAFNEAAADLHDLVERIVTTPAATTAGLLVKASVVKWGHMGEIDLGRRHPPDRRAAFSIVQDMLALAGAATAP